MVTGVNVFDRFSELLESPVVGLDSNPPPPIVEYSVYG